MGGISLAMGIGSSIGSAVNQSNASKEIRAKNALIEQQQAEDRAFFNRRYYQDITKRTEIQNMMRMLDEKQRKADTAVAARAAVTGATPEQQLASREVNRRTFADAVADIASNASAIRDQYLNSYQNSRNKYYAQRLGMQDQLASINANAANQWANAASNAISAGAEMLGKGLDELPQTGRFQNPKTKIDPVKPEKGAGSTYIAPPQAADPNKVTGGDLWKKFGLK